MPILANCGLTPEPVQAPRRAPLCRFLATLLMAAAALAPAQHKVHSTWLWHNHQPIYWNDQQVAGDDQYEDAWDSIVAKDGGRQNPLNDLRGIFGLDDRIAAYQYRPRTSVEAMSQQRAGATLNMSGALMENVHSLANAGQLGYSAGWQNNFITANGWTTPAGKPRLALTQFTYHHALTGLHDQRTIAMEIALHKEQMRRTYGQAVVDRSRGFFPTEMTFTERLIPTLKAAGIDWVIVSGEHIARACPDFPIVTGSGGVMCDLPNRADQTNPAGVNFLRKTISRGCSPTNAAPLSYLPHYARYVDPATCVESRIIVVPADQSNGWIDGYQCFGPGELAVLQSHFTTARPALVLLAHDGDNAFGGGFSYYQECVPNYVSSAGGAGVQPTTIDSYLAEYPVPANDVIHVEDGGWAYADSDFGSPTFINWNYPLLSASGQVDPVNGWHEKPREMALFTEALNRVLTAEQIAGGAGAVRIGEVLDPGPGTTPIERAWHYFLGSLDSGNVYFGAPLDLEIKGTIGCNEAFQHTDPIIAAAGPAADMTPPTIWVPQRHPYNPGSNNFGVQYGYQQRIMPTDFWVWTFVGEVSRPTTARLMMRIDTDGTNSTLTDHNETYAGGADVGPWVPLAMNGRAFPAGNVYNKPEINYFELPAHMADHFSVKVEGLENVLVDYYVEATDARGNVARSPIQHVWVGDGEGATGGGERVTVTPTPPVAGSTVMLSYDATAGPLSGSPSIFVHKGINNWGAVDAPDAAMTFNAATSEWEIAYEVPQAAQQIDFVFRNGSNQWDNNSGQDWHVLTTGGTGGGERVIITPNPPVAGQNVTVSFEDGGGPIASSPEIFIHKGINDWAMVDAPDAPMTFDGSSGRWTITYPVPMTATQIDMVFRNGVNEWDNNNGQDWHFAVSGGNPTPSGIIIIGAGPVLGTTAGQTWNQELQDWTLPMCKALDAAQDTFVFNDDRDGSRDLLAFYFQDDPANGKVFFRADFLELSLGAESTSLDLYVSIDFGTPAAGQVFLPDFTDCQTDTRWEVTVALYSTQFWNIYDQNFAVLSSASVNPSLFAGAYYRSDLDAVEFGIERSVLTAQGWDGTSPLNFQVYTTRDGTDNGAGEIAGASDLTDSIVDDDRGASDGILNGFFSSTSTVRGTRYAYILHGNQAISNASSIQDLIHSAAVQTPAGNPTGYRRALESAQVFDAAPNIHVSGSLISASLWADRPGAGFLDDGPEFIATIKRLVDGTATRGAGALVGGVYSEHIMPYFEGPVNRDSTDLNEAIIASVFDVTHPSATAALWIPERVAKGTTFADLSAAGYGWTILDQDKHLRTWYGDGAANAQGFKVHRVNGVNCFMINDEPDRFKFANSDGGLWFNTRLLLAAKANDADGEQVVLVFDDWEAYAGRSFTSFGTGSDNPDNWNRNIRWIANHPWIQISTLEEIAAAGWTPVDHGTNTGLPIETYDFLDHATEGSYDNWYFGSALEEDFDGSFPPIRRDLSQFGTKTFGGHTTAGTIAGDLRTDLFVLTPGPLTDLARFGYATGIFETAWHDEDNTDRCPDGTFCNPDTTFDPIAQFAKDLQFGSFRRTGIAIRAQQWIVQDPETDFVFVGFADLDHDGEFERYMFNNRVFAAFEDDGGRMTHLYVRARDGSYATQVIGNPLGFPDFDDERESDDVNRRRTSGLVDFRTNSGASYTNATPYGFVGVNGGWRITAPDNSFTKEITVEKGSTRLRVTYTLTGPTSLSVRHGLVADLLALLSNPGYTVVEDTSVPGAYYLRNTVTGVAIGIEYATNGANAVFDAQPESAGGNGARNQPMTHVVTTTTPSAAGMAFNIVVLIPGDDPVPSAVLLR